MTSIVKLWSVGDWEALFIGGEVVAQNHQGRIDVVDHLPEGCTISWTVSRRLNLPHGEHRYPSTLTEIHEDDRYDFDMSQLVNTHE